MTEEPNKFIRPLSLEAVAGLIVAFINLALDQADIHIMAISWLSVIILISLSIDACRRLEWVKHTRHGKLRLVVSSWISIVAFVMFGLWLSRHKRALSMEQGPSFVQANTIPKTAANQQSLTVHMRNKSVKQTTKDKIINSSVDDNVYRISPKDLPLFINSLPIKYKEDSTPIPIQVALSSNTEIVVNVHDDSDKTIDNFQLDFLIFNCQVSSLDPRWTQDHASENTSGMNFTAPPMHSFLNPGTFHDLPPLELNCDKGVTVTNGTIMISGRNMGPLFYHFTLSSAKGA